HHGSVGIRRQAKRPPGSLGGVMRFLVDAQLPPALARWLTERGHHAQHVADIGMMAATDHQIWQ
ncbi:MAG: DUF5615 family PIN-like protein, partial [Guyparkeria sp.]